MGEYRGGSMEECRGGGMQRKAVSTESFLQQSL